MTEHLRGTRNRGPARRREALRVLIAAFAVLTGALLISIRAEAGVCGDDVDGERVACSCGDVVVSNVRLRVGDPVVSARCPHDGLIVRAPAIADSIEIDLGGQVLAGSGHGYGILVERGGSDGAAIHGGHSGPSEKPGEIVGFGTGIFSSTSRGIRRIESLRATANAQDGIRLNAKGTVLIDVETNRNGRTGLAMRGVGGRVVGLESNENGNAGARIMSRGAIISGNASRNVRHGIVLGGTGNDISGFAAVENEGVGVAVHGARHKVDGFRAELNGKADVHGTPRTGR